MPRRMDPGGRRGQKRKRRSSTKQPSNTGWSDLPPELREMILETLEDLLQGGKAAAYASVSKEWNRILEPYIFRRLTLSVDRMRHFMDIVNDRRQPFVQFIWFRFERRPYSDSNVGYIHHKNNHHENEHINFAYTIYCLFQTLSEWEVRKAGQPGIVLELSAFSCVDPCHSMKDTVPKELRDVDVTEDSDALSAMYEKSPVRQVPVQPRYDTGRQRELGGFYNPARAGVLEVPFPTVRLITDLTVRRQMHSGFFGQHMGRLIKALPRLEFITYEPSCRSLTWDPWTTIKNEPFVENILNAMPSSIRRLQVLEDNSSLYNRYLGPQLRTDGRQALGQVAANISREKEPEALAMSFIIDAMDFFVDFATPQGTLPQDKKLGWTKLTSLVLTSSLIRPHCSSLPSLLEAAARAASHMPKLEIMELYHAAESHGGIFTYIHDEEGSMVLWECNWKYELPSDVINAWKVAARVHGTDILENTSDWIGSRDLGWPGRIISLLRTRETVVHPFTYGNMMNGLNHM
ncbi:hypothetical protein ACQKWADRAFT_304583 [Trichoderma austrokoningii]